MDPDTIFLPPLHIKSGLMKQFVKTLDGNRNYFNYPSSHRGPELFKNVKHPLAVPRVELRFVCCAVTADCVILPRDVTSSTACSELACMRKVTKASGVFAALLLNSGSCLAWDNDCCLPCPLHFTDYHNLFQ